LLWLQTQAIEEKQEEKQNQNLLNYLLSLSFIPMPEAYSAPLSFDVLLPKKEGGKFVGFFYFRFLMIKKPAIKANATITAPINIAISVVINGASVGSGSIGPPGDGASSTPIAVSA
jgi:hypothetical protein